MYRGFLWSLFAAFALAQIQYQEDPVQTAIRAYQTARDQGHFAEAAAKREQARSLLDRIPADSQQYGNSVRSVAQLYQNAGMSAKGLAIAQQALSRATDDNRVELLQMIADFYQQDRNLLQAVGYREKAVAAMDEAAAKPAKPETNAPSAGRIRGDFGGGIGFRTGISISRMYSPSDARTFAYQQLASLYQQLGRPDAVAAITKRMATIAKDPSSVAQFYQQQGQLDEATAIYKKQTEQADAPARANAFQSLASLYQQQQRYSDASDAYRQAIATVTASGKPEAAIWLRVNLASMLNQAGQTEAADQVYEQLLADTTNMAGSEHMQTVVNYANYLSETKRGPQASAILSDYLTSHPNMQSYEEANLLNQLSNIARQSGDSKLADEYQQASANRQQRSNGGSPPEQILIGKELQAAQAAVQAGKLDDAFALSMQAMDAAPEASDRERVSWEIPNIATGFVNKKQPAKAEQLYQRLLAVVESWSADNPQPLTAAFQNYANFLSQSNHWNEAPATIKRYRDLLVSMHGAASGPLADSYHLTMQFQRMHGSHQETVATAQELVALEESLSGNTSEPYLRGLEGLAREYQSSGDVRRAIPLFRQTIAIADLVFAGANPQRAHLRMNAAMVLAQQRQFDEAEQLATDAVAIGQASRPPQDDMFANQLAQIRKMREAPQANSNRAVNPWFTQSKPKD
jgi:hypothetical protein